jgi:tetratricopeptide (TPR) repeat protein
MAKMPLLHSRWLLMLLCFLGATALADSNGANSQPPQTAPASSTLANDRVKIDQGIFTRPWNRVPFDTSYFTFTDAQMEARWDEMMKGFKLPFPSVELIRYATQHYPESMEGVDPALVKDPARYQKAYLNVARAFFAGDFQQAYLKGKALKGAFAIEISAFSEAIYACYLTRRQSVKYMMLQDVINSFDSFKGLLNKMVTDKNPDIRANVAFVWLGYAYAIARIAEEAPVPLVLARGYADKVMHAGDKVLALEPDLPLGLAFRAGLNAGIIRRVGKFTGRLTYGARTTVAIDDFEKAVDQVPNQAIVQYEFANALIYMDRKRKINDAMRHIEAAIRARPEYAMEALDSMYAYKRLQEIRLYALDYRSFREFDDDRRHFIDVTDRNLHNISMPNLTLDMLKHPEKYRLPPGRD